MTGQSLVVADHPVQYRGRLLVVDDEPHLRMVVGRGLARFGWEVCLAADGEQALAQLRHGRHVTAVVSDITMPGMNGNELAGTILTSYARVPILFVTATQPDPALLSHRLIDHLNKPVRTTEIHDHLTHLVDLVDVADLDPVQDRRCG